MSGAARGSALVMAIFVLVLMTSLGIALLTLSQYELRLAQADARNKAVFYLAEAGLEDARETLLVEDGASANPGGLDDELDLHAGANDTFDLDPDALRPVYDGAGNVTGFSGYGDDVPLIGWTAFENGFYAAFLTNDPLDEAVDPLDDTNGRVVITAIGAGPGHAVEVVQAIVIQGTMPPLPATITLLGPTPTFEGGTSASKHFSGDDCDGAGIPDLHVPVVGTIGPDAEADAEAGVKQPATYVSGSDTGVDTVTDVEPSIHPVWMDCGYLRDLAAVVRAGADLVGDVSTPNGDLGTQGDPKVVYIEGDYVLFNNIDGGGLLWVTGEMQFSGELDWEGVILVVGTGVVDRDGGSDLVGGFLAANIAGPDGLMWTADDCAGPDGLTGTGDDGFEPAIWDTTGSGGSNTVYCTAAIEQVQRFPFRIDQFRQR